MPTEELLSAPQIGTQDVQQLQGLAACIRVNRKKKKVTQFKDAHEKHAEQTRSTLIEEGTRHTKKAR